jgi:MOSC domain-containing protein
MADSVDVSPGERTLSELVEGLDHVRDAPREIGTLELIVGRPEVDARVELASAELDVDRGLVADRWSMGSKPNPKSQVTVMNVRAAQLVAGDRSRWGLAGDQLYVDLDLSSENLPPGTKLAIGSAVIEVSDQPHLGCEKFAARFGQTARVFANSPEGTAVNFRGINTRVVRSGTVRVGDAVRTLTSAE